MIYKTQGIVIRKRDLSEADRLLTIYTRDFGKIFAKAKAVKKSQAKLKGHLELFILSDLMLVEGRGLDIVTGAETVDSFSFIHNCLTSLAGAYCLSELIDRLTAGPEADEDIWRLVLSSFQLLNKKRDAELLLKNFSGQFLELLGYGDFSRQDPYLFICSYLNSEINSFDFLRDLKLVVE